MSCQFRSIRRAVGTWIMWNIGVHWTNALNKYFGGSTHSVFCWGTPLLLFVIIGILLLARHWLVQLECPLHCAKPWLSLLRYRVAGGRDLPLPLTGVPQLRAVHLARTQLQEPLDWWHRWHQTAFGSYMCTHLLTKANERDLPSRAHKMVLE